MSRKINDAVLKSPHWVMACIGGYHPPSYHQWLAAMGMIDTLKMIMIKEVEARKMIYGK